MFFIPSQRLWRFFDKNPAWPGLVEANAEFMARYRAEQAKTARAEAERQRAEDEEWAEIEAEAEHMADMLPLYLHNAGLSYKRSEIDRKTEHVYERIEYCRVMDWQVTEDTYYFWIGTFYPEKLPYKVHISHFLDEENLWPTLSSNFGSKVWVEYSEADGLWVCVERRAGRGQIPRYCTYQELIAKMAKAADPLSFPLGMTINKRNYFLDLEESIHLLIGGQTGGGKSNMVNVMLTTLVRRNKPDQLRLFLADFKRVEFAFYRNIPHLGGDVKYLLTEPKDDEPDETGKKAKKTEKTAKIKKTVPMSDPTGQTPLGDKIITDVNVLIRVSEYILAEIDRRTMMLEGHVKKIGTWNKRYPNKKLSRWILVIDELADVMLQPKYKALLEPTMVRIAQLGRAVGIHLVLATQTPKTEVITQLIQNNIPTRIAFRCSTGIASGTMLDGKYDAARLPEITGRSILRIGGKMVEVQTPYISDMTIRETVSAIKEGNYTTIPTRTIAPEIIFKYALTELGGDCPVRDLFNHFRADGVSKPEMMSILKDYEVRGAPPCLEPEIEIDGDAYYLAPGDGGRKPRQLVRVGAFEADYSAKWEKLMFYVQRSTEAPVQVSVAETEIQGTQQIQQVEEAF